MNYITKPSWSLIAIITKEHVQEIIDGVYFVSAISRITFSEHPYTGIRTKGWDHTGVPFNNKTKNSST